MVSSPLEKKRKRREHKKYYVEVHQIYPHGAQDATSLRPARMTNTFLPTRQSLDQPYKCSMRIIRNSNVAPKYLYTSTPFYSPKSKGGRTKGDKSVCPSQHPKPDV